MDTNETREERHLRLNREAQKRWYERHKNTEKYKKMHREYQRKWSDRNREKVRKYIREYYRKRRNKENA